MNWLKRNYISLLTILAVIAIAVVMFIYRDQVAKLGNLGYLGAFLVSLISSTTIILPVPGFIILVTMSTVFNPVLIALAGSTGGALGEITGYVLGYSGRHMLSGNKSYLRAEGWMKRWGMWAIMLFAFVPLMPADIAGIASGALHYPLWKFLLACWIGKSAKFIGLLLASAWGWQIILRYFPIN